MAKEQKEMTEELLEELYELLTLYFDIRVQTGMVCIGDSRFDSRGGLDQVIFREFIREEISRKLSQNSHTS